MTTNSTPERGTTLYWRRVPEGRFTFVKTNPDGSYQLHGGEKGYAGTRDARPEDVSTAPFGNSTPHEQVLHYATTHLFEHVTIAQLCEMFGLAQNTIRKVVYDRPDLFRKVGHGVYECRDANADRKAGK